MRPPHRSLRVALPLALFLTGLGFGLPAPVARAEDGAEGGGSAEDLEAQIKAQMDKILRLMRENEKALLEASIAGGRKPAGVEVEPPPAAEGAGTAEGRPSGAVPPQGEEARRRIEELVRSTQERGGTIPGELENLVKMIPT